MIYFRNKEIMKNHFLGKIHIVLMILLIRQLALKKWNRSLKLNKTCAFDGISNEVVKNKDVVLYL